MKQNMFYFVLPLKGDTSKSQLKTIEDNTELEFLRNNFYVADVQPSELRNIF